jgi:DNA-binding PadR family transcriptional regulator
MQVKASKGVKNDIYNLTDKGKEEVSELIARYISNDDPNKKSIYFSRITKAIQKDKEMRTAVEAAKKSTSQS